MFKQIEKILKSGNFEPPENLTPERYAEVPIGTVFAACNGNRIRKTWYGCIILSRLYFANGGFGSEPFDSDLARGLMFNPRTIEQLTLRPATATPISYFEMTTKLYSVPVGEEDLILTCWGPKGVNVELTLGPRIIELNGESYRQSVLVNPHIGRTLKNPPANSEAITVLIVSDQPYDL